MGVQNGGNMFPGVTLPFGVVKIGVDMLPATGTADAYSGYLPSGRVTGFSLMHESGTGGAPKYGVVSQLPLTGAVENPLVDSAVLRVGDDQAEVGRYKTTLANGVMTELTAAAHAGMMRHRFAGADGGVHILVDVSHFLPSFRGQGIEQKYVEGEIEVDAKGKYTGFGVYNGGWNLGQDWKIYFCGTVDKTPSQARTFAGTAVSGETLESFGNSTKVSGKKRLGALLSFNSTAGLGLVVESKIGISFISTAKACEFKEKEIPESNSFEALVSAAKETWNNEVFSSITTTETDSAKLGLLYSSLYGMFLIPSNRTGENPGWTSTEPYYDDIFTLWDLFRSHTPLMHVLMPHRYEDYIRSLIDIWRHDGYLPDGRSSNFNGRVQGGSNADNVLADAYVKGVRGGINWDDGYKAMVKNGEVAPANNNDAMASDSSTKEGRGALPDWLEKGYITTKYSRSVSRASEYSLNDFALSQVAKGLGKTDDTEKYLNRSRNWRNHWDTKSTAFGFTGFLSPIDQNGAFPTPAWDPLSCGGCYWSDNYYQALPYEYSFGAHHDMETLIKYMGGDDLFTSRLAKLFEPGANPSGDARFGKTLFNPGNEPSFASPYLFNYVNRQSLSVQKARFIATSYYNMGNEGLPGNSDAGAMQSWLLWNMIGLYPITGSTTFLIGSPWLAELNLNLGDGKKVTIKTTGGSDTAYYVQSLKVNGEQWDRNWISWGDIFANGGTMEFVLGTEMKAWDTGARPPSYAT
ncbi:glycosyl hydrolase family 92-domain-containing protein [Morchella snyderi]|nr:glycosyl hydrolase family 92-domain-containing protein [Morchella snyderi]